MIEKSEDMSKEELFFENETRKHQQSVAAKLMHMAGLLMVRATHHDKSKLDSPEREVFVEVTPALKKLEYGSDEYKAQLDKMGVALEHHYRANRHHPEHHNADPSRSGVEGMSLVDVMEMFCDWCAAVERHETGDIYKSIEHNQERFGISPQLSRIFRVTAMEIGMIR